MEIGTIERETIVQKTQKITRGGINADRRMNDLANMAVSYAKRRDGEPGSRNMVTRKSKIGKYGILLSRRLGGKTAGSPKPKCALVGPTEEKLAVVIH